MHETWWTIGHRSLLSLSSSIAVSAILVTVLLLAKEKPSAPSKVDDHGARLFVCVAGPILIMIETILAYVGTCMLSMCTLWCYLCLNVINFFILSYGSSLHLIPGSIGLFPVPLLVMAAVLMHQLKKANNPIWQWIDSRRVVKLREWWLLWEMTRQRSQ